jgi:hypothetical protein
MTAPPLPPLISSDGHLEVPNTRPFAERLLADVPADEAFRIASGNVLDFFHLRDTPVGRKALAAMTRRRPARCTGDGRRGRWAGP